MWSSGEKSSTEWCSLIHQNLYDALASLGQQCEEDEVYLWWF